MSLFNNKPALEAIKNPVLNSKHLILLMLVIIVASTAHFLRMPITLSALIISALGLKVLMLWRGRIAANRLMLLLFTIVVTGLVFINYGTINGHEAGSALLVGMLGLKLLEAKNHRDAMICLFLTYFLTAVNFLFTQSIATAAWMFCQVTIITFCLITLSQTQYKSPWKFRAKFAVRSVLQAVPIMVVLFLLFPRIPGPLWGIPKPNSSATTGFSDTMSPGQFSDLAKSASVAFRVKFEGDIPQQSQLYWRGLVLWHYDGFTWNKGKSVNSYASAFEKQGEAIDYTVTLEPHKKKTLFTLDMPGDFKNAYRLDRNFQLSAKRAVTQVIQYQVSSFNTYRINAQLEPFEWRKGLQLPRDYNPQTIALGKQWKQDIGDPEKIVDKALHFFNQEPFYYTLRPPPLGKHKADDFLFNTRKGFCEYYSNAFVILMRAADIPARVVVGYMGGERNPINNNLTIRQSDAHAWAEVWLSGRGWVRIDPTAAVAPSRIEQNLDAALPEEDRSALPFFSKASPLKGLVNLWDAIDNGWNQWVLGYNPEFQRKFLARFGLEDFMQFTYAMIGLIGIALALFSFWMLRPVNKIKLTVTQKTFKKFCQRMATKGYTRNSHETASDYIKRLIKVMPQQERQLLEIARTYNRLRYENETSDRLEHFQNLVNGFKADIKP